MDRYERMGMMFPYIAEDGDYRVLLSIGTWIDIVDFTLYAWQTESDSD